MNHPPRPTAGLLIATALVWALLLTAGLLLVALLLLGLPRAAGCDMVVTVEANAAESWLLRVTEAGPGTPQRGVLTAERVDAETVHLKGANGELPDAGLVRAELKRLGFVWMTWDRLVLGKMEPRRFRI